MKSFRQFISETPTNAGPVAPDNPAMAGYVPFLFPKDMDLLDQGYQTPAEPGLNQWRFANVYPVMKVSLSNNKGDGPSIDSMVDASKEFVNIQDERSEARRKKQFSDLRKLFLTLRKE